MEKPIESLEDHVSKKSVSLKLTDLIPYKGYSDFVTRNDSSNLVRDYGHFGYMKLITSATILLSLNIVYTASAVYGAARAIIDLTN